MAKINWGFHKLKKGSYDYTYRDRMQCDIHYALANKAFLNATQRHPEIQGAVERMSARSFRVVITHTDYAGKPAANGAYSDTLAVSGGILQEAVKQARVPPEVKGKSQFFQQAFLAALVMNDVEKAFAMATQATSLLNGR